ncbi:hypothetical protein ACFXTN_028233 [Malus domestica]
MSSKAPSTPSSLIRISTLFPSKTTGSDSASPTILATPESCATLYLPPGYDPARDGPLLCLLWSYPKRLPEMPRDALW